MNRSSEIAIGQALNHTETAGKLLQEVLAEGEGQSGERIALDIEQLKAENAHLRQINIDAALEIESIRRDFGRVLSDMRETAGGHVPGTYCAYFKKQLIDQLWKHHEFDMQFGGTPVGAGGRLIDLPLTFSNYRKPLVRKPNLDTYGISDHLHAGCTYEGTIWMDEDSAQDFLRAVGQGLQVEFWTSAREKSENE